MDFKPIIWQETTRNYIEIKPAVALQSCIDCYWMSQSGTSENQTRVIPDLCADFIMVFTPEGTLQQLIYSGPNTHYFFSRQSTTMTIGVRFYISALRNWLPANLNQTKNQLLADWDGFEQFSCFLGEALKLNPNFEQLISRFDHFFLTELGDLGTRNSSAIIKNVLSNSLKLTDYRDVIQREILSERTIQRIFREETGLSPYEAYDILRFQKALRKLLTNPEAPLAELALDHGYYDQAHFTRRFKIISGLTPTEIRQNCRNYPRQ